MAETPVVPYKPYLSYATTHELVAELAVRHHAMVLAGVTKIRPDEARFECFGGTVLALGLVEQFAFHLKLGRINCGQLPPQCPRPPQQQRQHDEEEDQG